MKDSEYAYKAAEVIAERGHCHGSYINDNNEVCTLGAFGVVTQSPVSIPLWGDEEKFPSEDHYHRLVNKFESYLIEHLDPKYKSEIADGWVPTPLWNDRNTSETVILEIKRFASELEARGE